MNNLTEKTNPTVGSWSELAGSIKDSGEGERHPFFPLRDVKDGESVTFTVNGNPEFNREKFHGQYSMAEMDIFCRGEPFRLCISGTRLASAMAKINAGNGDRVTLTAKGADKSRSWTATVVRAGPPQVVLNHHA